MSRYTMRLTWPEPDRQDYVFKVDGKEAGRFKAGYCWHWTAYGSGFAGDELTLEKAQAKFKVAFEKGRM